MYIKDLDLKKYIRQMGFSEEQTRYLVNSCTVEIYGAIRGSIHTYLVMKQDDRRMTEIFFKQYGLSDITECNSPAGGLFGVGREIEGQLFDEALRVLQNQKAKTFLENNLRNQLAAVLEENPVTLTIDIEFPSLPKNKTEPVEMEKQKSYTFEEIRKKYPRAYMMWTDEEENWLLDLIEQGMTTKKIAKQLQRKNGAIKSRMKKIKTRNI